jgi:hypothetical protein
LYGNPKETVAQNDSSELSKRISWGFNPLRPWNNSDGLLLDFKKTYNENVSCRDWGIKHQLRPEERFANHPQ